LTSLDPDIAQLSSTLVKLTLSGNQLRSLPTEIGKLVQMRELVLSKNSLESLPESVGQLKKLQVLNCMLNKIADLPDSLGELAALERLKLSVNQLHVLPSQLGALTALLELDVSSNHITELPDVFDSLAALENLNIRNNLLDSLPKSICAAVKLRTLDARNNELAGVPRKLGDLKALKSLFLSQNQIENLPSSIGNLAALHTLQIDQNQLWSLPPSVFEIASLVVFDAHRNFIEELPDDDAVYAKLDKLTSLDLRLNALAKLPAGIGGLVALKKLYLTGNQLTTLPKSFGKLVNLLEVELAQNQLEELPAEIAGCKKLTMVDVSDNKLTALPKAIGKLRPLMQLKVGGNQLTELAADLFDELPELLYLNVFHNQLRSLPASLCRCPKLQRLDCAYNEIKALPKELPQLKALQYLVVSGNQFKALPKEVCVLPLKELYVSNNQLTELPDDIARLAPTLTVLDCVGNRIAALPDAVGQLVNLKELEVGHNALQALPASLAQLKQLINLDLSENVELQLDGELLTALVSLTQLKLGYCRLQKFPPVTKLPAELALITLEGNRLVFDELPDVVKTRTELSAHSSSDKSYFEVSWAEMRGMRPTQEDTLVLHTNALSNLNWKQVDAKKAAAAAAKGKHSRDMGICAVFDGHRGSGAAEYAASHLVDMLYENCATLPIEKALKNTFNELSAEIIDKKIESGTTALVTVVCGSDLYIGNCGDARAVLCRDGNAVRLSVDHKPDDPLERKRIRELGGYVSYTGRILDDILVARSLGDAQNQPFVTSEPYVAHFDLSDKDEFVILGCDGIWDVISDDQAVALVKEYGARSFAMAAVALRDCAYSAGSTDNLSVLIINLATGEFDATVDAPLATSGKKKKKKAKAAKEDAAAAAAADDADADE
jgi:Leucine-rich repeat (LRR) protein/serine/threonine protein phosphatase PrpC